MKASRRKSHISLTGYAAFFGLIALITTCAILISAVVTEHVSNDFAVAGIMLAVIVILATLCTIFDWFRRRIQIDRPVNQILDATERIAGGDFGVRLNPSHAYAKYDAYDLIMENLNKMAAELSHNEVLKTDFISNVSHEIKTPLSVITNYTTLLQDPRLSEKERAEFTKKLLSATQRLTDLVMNILQLNKLENQIIREQKTRLRLGDLLGEIILTFEEGIERKNIELICDIDDIVTSADRTFVEIICGNLLSNAVKFTGSGGRIEVSLKDRGDAIELEVRDTGCGMDAETGAHIFDKFYQGDTSHSQEGNGLGLALVKRVIDNMGGEISVSSELGRGSTFFVKWKK